MFIEFLRVYLFVCAHAFGGVYVCMYETKGNHSHPMILFYFIFSAVFTCNLVHTREIHFKKLRLM